MSKYANVSQRHISPAPVLFVGSVPSELLLLCLSWYLPATKRKCVTQTVAVFSRLERNAHHLSVMISYVKRFFFRSSIFPKSHDHDDNARHFFPNEVRFPTSINAAA